MEVDAISLRDRDAGNVFWGRNVGTDGHVWTQEWVERNFRDNGLQDVHRQAFDLRPQWRPRRWDITFERNGQSFTLESARPPQGAASTPSEGLEFDLVWVGLGSEADYLGRDVGGKAVLILDLPRPGTLRHSIRTEGAVERAYERGAGAVGIVYGISDNFAVWQRTGDGPGFNIGYEDGLQLRDMLGHGDRLSVRLGMDSAMVEGLQAASVWGTLPGASDEEILIIAHMDGYFRSALDNASGLAVMMGLLEHYAKLRQEDRPRTLRFLGSVGHHGGPGTRWLHDHRDTALANTVLAINLEHVAAVRTKYWGPHLRMMNAVSPMRWWVNGSPTLLDIVLDSFNRFNVGITGDMDLGASGEMGSMDLDVPSVQVITSPEIKHTEQDTPEWVPAVGLEQIARAYAKIIDGVNGVERGMLQPVQSSTTESALATAILAAQDGSSAVEAHRAAARAAAGDDHQGLFRTVCRNPRPDPQPASNTPRPPREVPPLEEWYAEPAQVFDNLYFVGTRKHGAWAVTTSDGIIVIDALYDYAVEPAIEEGLRKLGLDPAEIKYVVVSHGHGDHHGGAKHLQDRFGARIVMGGPDWDLVERSTRDPIPARDMVATDEMRLRLGETTVTLYLTPGHTAGTVSTMIEVRDGGRSHLTAAWGGTSLSPNTPREAVESYIDAAVRFQQLIETTGADVLVANHTIFDRTPEKLEALKGRQPGDPHPYVIGNDAVRRYVKVAEECARAELAARGPE